MDDINVLADRVLFCLKYKRIKWAFGLEKRAPTKQEVKKILLEIREQLEIGETITQGGLCVQRINEKNLDVYVFVGDLGHNI